MKDGHRDLKILNDDLKKVIHDIYTKTSCAPNQIILSTQAFAVILLRAGNAESIVFKILGKLGFRHRKIKRILKRATKIKSQLDKPIFTMHLEGSK